MIDPVAFRERQEQWRRFARWVPPPSRREFATRIAWLDEVTRIARERGSLEDSPIDSPEIRARRRRIREGLEQIRE